MGAIDYNVVIRGVGRDNPPRFAEIDAEIDALHSSRTTVPTVCHRQTGVNLLRWGRHKGGFCEPP
ncbi:hypothetical protein SAMN05421858_4917 [Haladaptatus litoreus]|uniref:Uncharacterized protein n=1 Tax=Haladaptatus litoreus TaxID=553468 RepID=A0A1N7FBR7_9EURY|nr:hypothetical protein SAMN05421858_4917 [Haladaptatus litoreus]